MVSTRFRAAAGAAALTVAGMLALAAPAHAAEASITLDPPDMVFVDDPLVASGTCTDGSRTAVVTVTQDDQTVTEEAVTLSASLGYEVVLDLSSAMTGDAAATVECFRYAEAAPLGSDTASFFIVGEGDITEIDVTVSPATVVAGKTTTISATCPAGSEFALVMIGSRDDEEPFLEEEVELAADGSVSYVATIPADTPAGDAMAVVMCGTEDTPTAFGQADLTITRPSAAPAPTAPVTPEATPVSNQTDQPELADTGAFAGRLAALGSMLVLTGAGAYRLRLRRSLV